MTTYRGRVLVTEDDPDNRALLADALAGEGYEVAAVADGRAALDLLRTWQPDLILLDLLMPGLDGPGFRSAQRALGMPHDTPVIVLSAVPSAELKSQARALGAAAAVSKPFDLDSLLGVVQRLTADAQSV